MHKFFDHDNGQTHTHTLWPNTIRMVTIETAINSSRGAQHFALNPAGIALPSRSCFWFLVWFLVFLPCNSAIAISCIPRPWNSYVDHLYQTRYFHSSHITVLPSTNFSGLGAKKGTEDSWRSALLP